MRHIEVGRAQLAVEDSGGTGPAVLALHAGVADSRVWHACTDAWVEAGWRVLAYDRRGHGRSTWQPEPFSHLTDLLSVLDASEVAAAVMVGNSQGGRIALDAALDAPDRVAGLVLVGTAITGAPHPFGAAADPVEDQLDAAADAAAEAGDIELANQLEAHLWLDGARQREGRVGGAARQLFLDMNGVALAATDPGQATWGEPAWPRVGEVAAPTQVIIGSYDLTPVKEWSRDLARRIPSATLVELADSAHLPMLDDPTAFLAATGPFLTSRR